MKRKMTDRQYNEALQGFKTPHIPPKNPRGNPAPLGNKYAAVADPLTARDAFRCTEAEKESYAQAAKSLGLSKSEFLRLAANTLVKG
jgi:hypothetical protein